MVDEWQEIQLTREGDVSTTRQRSEVAGDERVNALTDLVENNTIVAIEAKDVAQFDYYLLQVKSNGAVVLESDECDDYDVGYPTGSGAFLPS